MGCVEDVYRVCLRILWDVYVWSIGVRYIYLISVILNAYGGYDIQYIFNFTHRRLLSLFHIFIGLKRHVRFNSQFTSACRLRFLVDLYGRLENIATSSCC